MRKIKGTVTSGLDTGTAKERAYTKKHILPLHLEYVRFWQKSLDLAHCSFVVRAKKATKTVPFASIQRFGRSHVYFVWLTPRTLCREKHWKDSIIHELLHALFWEYLGYRFWTQKTTKSSARLLKRVSRAEELAISQLSKCLVHTESQ